MYICVYIRVYVYIHIYIYIKINPPTPWVLAFRSTDTIQLPLSLREGVYPFPGLQNCTRRLGHFGFKASLGTFGGHLSGKSFCCWLLDGLFLSFSALLDTFGPLLIGNVHDLRSHGTIWKQFGRICTSFSRFGGRFCMISSMRRCVNIHVKRSRRKTQDLQQTLYSTIRNACRRFRD